MLVNDRLNDNNGVNEGSLGEIVMATTRKKAKTSEEKLNLDSILFKCRDILRQARNSGSFFEKRDMMLTLVFLRFYRREV